MSEAAWYRQSVAAPCEASRAAALRRQDELTKPRGSLGRLEEIAVELASRQGTDRPSADRVAIVIFAADHGVSAEGVSAFPSEVTTQMLANFVSGGAAIAILRRSLGATLTIVDVGTFEEHVIPEILSKKAGRGTRNFAREPAMTQAQLAHCLGTGMDAVEALRPKPDLLVAGEMGIANTTSAAAVAAAILARPASELVGSGTGVSARIVARKAALIDGALKKAGALGAPLQPLEALQLVGGFEIAALTGAIIRASQAGSTIVVDGFIVSVAALCAVRLNPGVRAWLTFAHRSAEQGHRRVLDALEAQPLLDLGMRLGEASGAAVAVPLLRLACHLHCDMATLANAGVGSGS
jgi:nicotinate-nucleotide--dimethylbenzimidazole phosphoribosyltransferase